MTIKELLVCTCKNHIFEYIFISIKQIKLRQLIGISLDHPIRLRVLSQDGLRRLFALDDDLDRTVGSYDDELKPRMILSIEDDDEINHKRNLFQRSKSITSSEQTYSCESDV